MSMIDYHVHTTFSDGANTPQQMIDEAVRLGITELAITDHYDPFAPTLARFGHTPEELARHFEVIRACAQGKPLRVFCGIETSTGPDGRLRVPPRVLNMCQTVITSVHYLEGDILVHSLMPVCALTLVTVPKLFFTARASFFTILGRPYLTNARAKGLTAGRIRTAYILRNAATPIVARFFLSVGGAVGGTILVENVFAYPGLGTVLREAVQYRDYPMLQGVFLLSAVLVLLSLAAADVVNRRLDGEEEGP